MDDEKYVQKQRILNKKALLILKDLHLIEILSKFGEVHIVGSVALGLMSWPDIDLIVLAKPNVKNFIKLVSDLFPMRLVYSMNIQDFRKSIYPNRPKGLYCGLQYIEKPNIFWKIDIWFLLKSEDRALSMVEWVKDNMNEEMRRKILRIKNQMRDKLENGKQISGMEVYKAVIEKNVTSLTEFENIIKKSYKVE